MKACPHGESEAGAKTARQDRGIGALFAIGPRARRDRGGRRTRTGPHEHGQADWPAADGDAANGLPGEALLAGVGADHDLVPGEMREASGRPDTRPVLDLDLIVEVGPKRQIGEKPRLNPEGRRRDGRAGLEGCWNPARGATSSP